MRKTKFRNITIINNLITPQDIAKLRSYIDYSPLQAEENNPNKFINVQDNECNAILSKAQQLLKSNIEEDFGTLVSDEGIGTVVKFSIGWELPYHCDQWSNLPTYGGAPKRDISSIIYLSDDFKGGELVFPDLDVFIQPTAGSAIYFTGTEEYMHQVTPLLSGTRLTCTGFWCNLSGYDNVSIP